MNSAAILKTHLLTQDTPFGFSKGMALVCLTDFYVYPCLNMVKFKLKLEQSLGMCPRPGSNSQPRALQSNTLTLSPLQTTLVQSKTMNGRVHCSYLVLEGLTNAQSHLLNYEQKAITFVTKMCYLQIHTKFCHESSVQR